ncbi:MAG: triose-phosphate isomerase [Candidatus Omnitrophica bacterium]|nr:triose-phosphate isomerase [Candidatus Omnitrophota bacterium]
MRKPLIAGNWKMHKIVSEAVELTKNIVQGVADVSAADVLVCPPFTALAPVYKELESSSVQLGAQNVHWETQGAFTGEVSPLMVKDAGCEYVIVGHSERRQYFGETDQTVNKRLNAVLGVGLIPVLCIGESLQEREAEQTSTVIEKQLRDGLNGISEEDARQMVIAYEPVWAIGTGKTATPEQAGEVHHAIRAWLSEAYSQECAAGIRILYGGSVKPGNIGELMTKEDIDGALVGGASLTADSFVGIVKNAIQ